MSKIFTFPKAVVRPRIAFIADVPKKGSPFGISESFLYNLSSNARASGVDVNSCLLGSVLQSYPGYVPTGADIKKGRTVVKKFDWSDHSTDVLLLESALADFSPEIIIPLGRLALRYFKRDSGSLDDERGAPFYDHQGRLCLATYHPRDLFMRFELTALAQFDIDKAKRLANEGWAPPSYNINYLPSYPDVITKLNQFLERKPYLSVDIETFYKTKDPELDGKMTCIGIAYSTKDAIVIPWVALEREFSLNHDVSVS